MQVTVNIVLTMTCWPTVRLQTAEEINIKHSSKIIASHEEVQLHKYVIGNRNKNVMYDL